MKSINLVLCIKKDFIKLLKNSEINQSAQQLVLNEGNYDETTCLIEFHIDDCDLFHNLTKDLPLRGMISI